MASSRYNSSTPVLPLGTPFNTISCFSDQMAYLPNVPWRSRRIHQRGHLSPRSPSSTTQPGQTVSPVPGPSIVLADNDPNWEDAPANLSTNNNITNRPTSSTHSWSKPHWSDNTNEQLAEVLSRLANTLNVKIVDSGLYLIFFSLFTLFYFSFPFYFSIFRTAWVRVYQSHCHISHKLMV